MLDKQDFAFTQEEATAFIRRYGLKKLAADQTEAMSAAMERIALAGSIIPRAASKFDPPAPVFRVGAGR